MPTMDVKATSWVGDMYQKFEAMCLEVEETMCQDSVKYVENQVKTVGASVKKFYSGVIQDLLSSDDEFKSEISGARLVRFVNDGICDKPDLDTRREPVKVESQKLSRDSHLASQLDENVVDRLASQESSGVKCLGLQVKQSSTAELCNPRNVDSQLALLSKDGGSRAGEAKMSNEIDKTNECGSGTSVISSSSEATTWDEHGNDQDISKKQDGASYEAVENEIGSDDDDKEALPVQVPEQLSKMKLDGSCVLVDKYEHFSVSHLEGKQRSYKKKFRDVFYLRRWSRRSKNLKQLDVFQGEMDSSKQESRKIVISASALESGNTNLQSNPLESGWEIL